MTSLHPVWLLLQNYGNVKIHPGGETVYVPHHYKEAKYKLKAHFAIKSELLQALLNKLII
jgi:hypothetical protein